MASFRDSDVVLVTDIYAAGEEPIEGVTAQALVEDLKRVALPDQEVAHVGDLEAAAEAVCARLRDGDLVICLGAGHITRLPDLVRERVKA